MRRAVPYRNNLTRIILISVLFLSHCEKSDTEKEARENREILFCKNITGNSCEPPVIEKKVYYPLSGLNHKGSLRDYFNSIYFSGDTLSFEMRFHSAFSETLLAKWKNQFMVTYSFPDIRKEYPMERVDFSRQSITGFSLLGTILENRYSDHLSQPYRNISVVNITIHFYLHEKKLGERSLTVYLNDLRN